MTGPLKTMMALIRKLRRKRKLSTELHSRWGDVSITYPTEGSWSQWNQPSGFVANTATPSPDEGNRQCSLDSHDTASYVPSAAPEPNDDTSPEDSILAIPTGHYDSKLRHRSKPPTESCTGLRITGSRQEPRPRTPSPAEQSESADDNDNDTDTSPPTPNKRGRYRTETTRKARAEAGAGTSSQRASKSPPLSVTSRMRRHSQQSNSTEPTTLSMPNTASSQNTSFAASSLSAEDPRLLYNGSTVYQEKKLPLRKYHEPDTVVRQELVPSYDELYG